jgi:transcription elongation factor GreA
MDGIVFYLTKPGLKKIKTEYEKLLSFKHQKTTGETPILLHSEEVNPEYLAFQEDMTLLETRIAEHENILNNVEIIKPPAKEERGSIRLGATITLEIDGSIDEFMLVGTIEADPAQKRISNESPLGKVLVGARVGSTVKLDTAMVNRDCKVLKIRYEI